ncbi:hypothetical protein [Streptomyces rimosus]|uniref:hypothetical protein n=1 Tax=Streptomyces rimosus TaxID=1927 RepID=UPI0004CA6F21|nr:hypothetical protein [Streptomyces rimosus]
MGDIKADRLGFQTGTYALNCGCRIYVHFPGGHIHLSHGWSQCEELARLWRLYWQALSPTIDPHNWESLTRYLFCLRHVGAWSGRIAKIEQKRSKYRNPADTYDYPAVSLIKEKQNAQLAA